MRGTWNLEGLSGSFEMSRADKRWSGVYTQEDMGVEMAFDHMNIWNNLIEGRGADEVGEFTISGDQKPDGQVNFVKQYIGQHSVQYEGQLVNNKIISGQWKIPSKNSSGTFEIYKVYDSYWDL